MRSQAAALFSITALVEDIATKWQQIESISTVEQGFIEFVGLALNTVKSYR